MSYSISATGALSISNVSGIPYYSGVLSGVPDGLYYRISGVSARGLTDLSTRVKVASSGMFASIVADLQANGFDTTGSAYEPSTKYGLIKMDWS